MAGLINDSALTTTGTAANPLGDYAKQTTELGAAQAAGNIPVTTAKSFGYDPTLSTVNIPTDTVSGQLNAILGKDTPYMTMARQSGVEAANASGRLNTTMGAQAGEAAAIGAALPIATSDSGAYSQQRLANQGFSNQASQFGAAAANQAGIINAAAANDFGKIGLNTEAQGALAKQKAGYDVGLQTVQGGQQSALQKQAQDAALALAKSNNDATSALNISLQQMRGASAERIAALDAATKAASDAGVNVTKLVADMQTQINAINTTPDMSTEAKAAAIDKATQDLTTHIQQVTTAAPTKTAAEIAAAAPTITSVADATAWMVNNNVSQAQVLAAFPGREAEVKRVMGWA